MKRILPLILGIVLLYVSCKKEPDPIKPIPINHFVNTIWEFSNSAQGVYFTIDFFNETECKETFTFPIVGTTVQFMDYTFDEYKVTVIMKENGKTNFTSTMNGNTMKIGSNIYTRIK